MILEKETFKKFGYWPKDLTTGTTKPVLWRCEDCYNVFMTRYSQILGKKTNSCQKCSQKHVVKIQDISGQKFIIYWS